jgi:flagellar FliJ protein
MSRLKRLAPIMELAETKEKKAAQDLGLSQQKLDEARKGLSSLRSFRENYAALFHESGNKGLGVRQLAEYRAFLNKINVAVGEQEKVVQACEAELQARKAAWEDAHRHTLGMQKIMDKLHVDEARQEQHREQVELDERAGRRGSGPKTLLTVFL